MTCHSERSVAKNLLLVAAKGGAVALVPGTLLWREDFARRIGASGARPRAERRSALRVGCGYAALLH